MGYISFASTQILHLNVNIADNTVPFIFFQFLISEYLCYG